jgi:tyrosinase
MRLSQFLTPLGFAAVVAGALADRKADDADSIMSDLNDEAYEALENLEGSNEKRAACSLSTATIRRDWYVWVFPSQVCKYANIGFRAALSKKERLAYIDAVKCLQSKPSQSDPNWAPGAKTRYDDFVAIHIDLTTSIHSTVSPDFASLTQSAFADLHV